jgi:hypothetical protein
MWCPVDLQEFIARHRAAALECQARGQACCAQLHQEIIADLAHLPLSRLEMHARILASQHADPH